MYNGKENTMSYKSLKVNDFLRTEPINKELTKKSNLEATIKRIINKHIEITDNKDDYITSSEFIKLGKHYGVGQMKNNVLYEKFLNDKGNVFKITRLNLSNGKSRPYAIRGVKVVNPLKY